MSPRGPSGAPPPAPQGPDPGGAVSEAPPRCPAGSTWGERDAGGDSAAVPLHPPRLCGCAGDRGGLGGPARGPLPRCASAPTPHHRAGDLGTLPGRGAGGGRRRCPERILSLAARGREAAFSGPAVGVGRGAETSGGLPDGRCRPAAAVPRGGGAASPRRALPGPADSRGGFGAPGSAPAGSWPRAGGGEAPRGSTAARLLGTGGERAGRRPGPGLDGRADAGGNKEALIRPRASPGRGRGQRGAAASGQRGCRVP